MDYHLNSLERRNFEGGIAQRDRRGPLSSRLWPYLAHIAPLPVKERVLALEPYLRFEKGEPNSSTRRSLVLKPTDRINIASNSRPAPDYIAMLANEDRGTGTGVQSCRLRIMIGCLDRFSFGQSTGTVYCTGTLLIQSKLTRPARQRCRPWWI